VAEAVAAVEVAWAAEVWAEPAWVAAGWDARWAVEACRVLKWAAATSAEGILGVAHPCPGPAQGLGQISRGVAVAAGSMVHMVAGATSTGHQVVRVLTWAMATGLAVGAIALVPIRPA
jgi:hypothetical protein